VIRRALVAGAALVVAAAACQKREKAEAQPSASDAHPEVVLETTKGRIVLELDRNAAPKTVENIVAHVDQHFYDGLVFHRVIRDFVIQAGIQTADGRQRISSAPPVPNEADNGLKNGRGSVALARTQDPQSGGVQFYVNLKDNQPLDFKDSTVAGWGYCVFGRVKEGMDVADAIGRVRTRPDDSPVEPVVITRAFVDTTAASPAPSAK
jgi:peptidyl-prolyl cis-trans isomerase B (cyclophilin B)